ncbi:MAG: MarR family transcriptional regulator [Rhodobacteraceae bacterium]|jgi:DNA-binding MarR family transcriptional regulator|nr:MarR family transcriptional regulator [Alphaproteobacteria bacterium]MBT8476141.1 MarR family transcriptional regulator [Alphaproteobacteria bacterium]NNF71261.1 MarR family transcriptional regulator [Paracoccaceae bacterium]NNK67964.1 MarR family transcriptional regulator [Paracoccaceae bacterium]
MGGFALDTFLPYQLAVVARRVSLEYSKLYQQRFGISIPEWRVVAHLSQAGAVSVREIHDRVDMDKSKVSRAAARLEQNGYIQKTTSATDRRLVELRLTDKGEAMVRELTPIAQAFEADVMRRIGDDALAFRAGLETLMHSNDEDSHVKGQ